VEFKVYYWPKADLLLLYCLEAEVGLLEHEVYSAVVGSRGLQKVWVNDMVAVKASDVQEVGEF
jgi:hypothetical protein